MKANSDLGRAAFEKTFPQHRGWFSNFDAFSFMQRNGGDEHLADIQRRKKTLLGDMRGLLELSETEKRELSSVENMAFGVCEEIIVALDTAIQDREQRNHSVSSGRNYSGGSIHDPQKIIFRSNEKVAESRPPMPELRGLSIGKIMLGMLLGSERAKLSPEETRALSELTTASGGATVPEHLMSQFIDKLRAKSIINLAGATTVILNTQKTAIARLTGDVAASWRAELAPIPESDAAFDRVELVAKSLAAYVKCSRELLDDSINAAAMLENSLAQALALELDRAAIFGAGTGSEPLGLTNTPSVLTYSMGTNGAALTNYAPIVAAMQKLAEANAEAPSGIVMSPRSRYALEGLTATDGQPLNPSPLVSKIPMYDSASVPNNLTQGTATNSSLIVVGNFAELLLGIRQNLQIEIDRITLADSLTVRFIAHLRADVALAHPQSFCAITGVVPGS